jgi:hypothetical protein
VPPQSCRRSWRRYSDGPSKKLRIVTSGVSGGKIVHGSVTRRPPIPLYVFCVPRTGATRTTLGFGVWGLSIVQGPFSAAPRPNPNVPIRDLCVAVGAGRRGRGGGGGGTTGQRRGCGAAGGGHPPRPPAPGAVRLRRPRGTTRPRHPPYGDQKVANRDIRVWHGATENGP